MISTEGGGGGVKEIEGKAQFETKHSVRKM